jgi:hypothetical protein
MDLGAYLVGIFAGCFYLIASVRLWRLSRRTGERPELLLSLFFACSGQWYLLFDAAGLLEIDPLPSAVQQGIEWIYAVGVVAYVCFLRRVFRADAAWARVVAWISSSLIIAGAAGSTIRGGFSNEIQDPAFLIEWVGYTIPCIWMFAEGLVAHSAAKKRACFGLGDGGSANRWFLWTCFGFSQIASCVADLRWAYQNSVTTGAASMGDELLGFVEISSVAVLWLVFFPPSIYAKWVARRAARRETGAI